MTKLIAVVLLLACALPVQAAPQANTQANPDGCAPCEDTNAPKRAIQLNVSYDFLGDPTSNTTKTGVALEFAKKGFNLYEPSESHFIYAPAKLYYKSSNVELQAETDRTTNYGIGLAKYQYRGSKNKLYPFVSLDLDRTTIETMYQTGAVRRTIHKSKLYVWGVGMEEKFNDYASIAENFPMKRPWF